MSFRERSPFSGMPISVSEGRGSVPRGGAGGEGQEFTYPKTRNKNPALRNYADLNNINLPTHQEPLPAQNYYPIWKRRRSEKSVLQTTRFANESPGPKRGSSRFARRSVGRSRLRPHSRYDPGRGHTSTGVL